MKTKADIVKNWLPRYTGLDLAEFGDYILLTNFGNYVKRFAKIHGVKIKGENRTFPSATSGNITIINFGMGSPNAATIMDKPFFSSVSVVVQKRKIKSEI